MNRREAIQLMIIAGIVSEAPLLSQPLPADRLLQSPGIRVTRLRCEYRNNPSGIDVDKPRLSWILEAETRDQRNLRQKAYRIIVASGVETLERDRGDLWDSGRVVSDSSIQIEYDGKPLQSQIRAWWKVKVWDHTGRSCAWSEPAAWSMGLLNPKDWQAKWIGLDGGEGKAEEMEDAQWISSGNANSGPLSFQSVINISEDNPVSCALMMIAGTDAITILVNGTKVSSSAGHSTPQLFAGDITPSLHVGTNYVVVTLHSGSPSDSRIIGGLTLDLADGTVIHRRTGKDWKVSGSDAPVSHETDLNSAGWSPVHVVDSAAAPTFKPIRTRLPARMLRKEFQLNAPVRRATAYISGVGLYEMYLNDQKAGDEMLAPNLSDYDKRVYYRTHDVSELLKSGRNAIGIFLGNGRYFSLRNYNPHTRIFGYPKVILQLEIEFEGGTREAILSDETWKVTSDGPIRANNEYDGEQYDARMELDGWDRTGYRDAAWKPAELVHAPLGRLTAQMNEPIRIIQELRPVRITQPRPGVYVFDMGQNMVGWCKLQVKGPRGTRVRLRHAETLRPDGMLYTDNLRSARATDIYTLHGSGNESYHPRFTYHGFRYVELTGFPGKPTLSTITGQVIHDALDEHADFATSNDLLNRIYKNILWGTKGNYRSIPTDCPQRDERQGWLGDRSAESKGETFLFNVSAFYAKWVTDIGDTMTAQGVLDDVAPGYYSFYKGDVTWPATFIIVAANMYEQYGDRRIIEDHYPAMKRWTNYMSTQIKNDLMPCDAFGDWCVPPESLKLIHSQDPARQTDPEVLGTTYFYYLLQLMSRFAALTETYEDQRQFDALSQRLRLAFNAKYFHPDINTYANGSQTSSILPLAFGMVPEDHRQGALAALVENIQLKTKGHIGTGLIGAQWIMRTLSNHGHSDTAYQIATQQTYPSWGYMVSKGATTVWELWNGDTAAPDMNSMNHLMLVGDLITWFYENLAGIRADPDYPGFKHIIIHPTVTENLRFVRASHNSPHGEIATAWELGANLLSLNVAIPANSTATVYVPAKDSKQVRERGKDIQHSTDIQFLGMENGAAVYKVGSGNYTFTVPL